MKNNRNMTRYIAICAMMFAITTLMAFTPLGTIPLVVVNASVAFLPTIVSAIILGPVAGIIVGTFAGLMSFLRSILQPTTILTPYFQNPMVSVLPRATIGITVYFMYRILKNTELPQKLKIGISAAVGSITNTALVLFMLYVFYASDMIAIGVAPNGAVTFLMSIAATNGIAELIVNTLLAVIVVTALQKAGVKKL
ncbi:MAG: ECF transporter S component [Defluviitaleaceae bacterium]|nr:ECF transporter S component [Defluviitaleaceae bacterium]